MNEEHVEIKVWGEMNGSDEKKEKRYGRSSFRLIKKIGLLLHNLQYA